MDGVTMPTGSLVDRLTQAQAQHVEAKRQQGHEAALMFEGMLWMQMAQSMRATIQPSGLFGESGQARSTYEFMLDQAVVENAMKSGKSLGLADRLERAWAAQGSQA